MRVAYQDLEIYQGSTQKFEVIIFEDNEQKQPADLTGYSARSSIRRQYTYTDVAAVFQCSIGPITVMQGDWNPSGLNAITLSMSAAVSDGLTENDYVYDVEIYKPADSNNSEEIVYRVLEGKIYINPSVTR